MTTAWTRLGAQRLLRLKCWLRADANFPGVELRLFGGLRLVTIARPDTAEVSAIDVEIGGPLQRFVLAVLAIECNQVVPSDRLIDLLWPEQQDKKLSSLQAYVSNLRKAMQSPAAGQEQARQSKESADRAQRVVRQANGYRLVMDRSAVDVLRFEDLVLGGQRHLASGEQREAMHSFTAAIDLWSGSPVPEFAHHGAVIAATERWRNLLAMALESVAELHLEAGDALAALLVAEPRIDEFPVRERLHRLVALGLYRVGRQTEALRLIARTRQSLIESAGLDIGADLANLEGRILSQDPTLDGPGRTDPTEPPVVLLAGRADSRVVPLLIGRDADLAVLQSALAGAAMGRGGVVTVVGEPGIGKSALVERFTDDAAAAGTAVAWSRNLDGGVAPPYWPLVHIESQLRAAGAIPDDADAIASSAQPDPFVFARRLSTVLQGGAGTVIIVIDDVQWADDDSLRVLVHLVAELRRTRVLLVLTAHSLTVEPDDRLANCADELARQSVAAIRLAELAYRDVDEWLVARCARTVSSHVVGDLFARAGGSPLFLRELIDLIAPESNAATDDASLRNALAAVPPELRPVVRRRLRHLSGAAQQLLTVASVLGVAGDVAVLADVIGIATHDALDQLDAAIHLGVITVGPDATFRFSHGIVAETLASELTSSRKAGIHAAAARSLADRYPDDEHSALVAHHATAGAVAGTVDLAVRATVRAARFAEVRGASGDAAHHWKVAANVLERFQPTDRRGRLDALIAAASAHERADQMIEAQALVIAALDLARADGDPAIVERAVAILNHVSIYPNQAYGIVNQTLIALLTDCLATLPAGPSSARATVLAALTTELFHTGDVEWRDRVSAESLAIARQLDDPAVLARALHAQSFTLKAPSDVRARRAGAVELSALAVEHRLSDDIRLLAEHQIVLADYALGDLVAAHDRLAPCVSMLARPVNQALRLQIGFFQSLLEVVGGRYEAASTHFDENLDLLRTCRPTEVATYRLGHLLTIGHDIGGIPEQLLVESDLARVDGYTLSMRLCAAVILFDLGRPADALRMVPYQRGTAPQRPSDYTTIFIDTAASIIAAETGDAASAVILLDRVLPFAGRWASGSTVAFSFGFVDLAIARLLVTLGRLDEARSWFATTIAAHERVGAPAWMARTLLHQGRFLLDAGQRDAALAALDRGLSIADMHGVVTVASRLRTTLSSALATAE